MQVIATTTQSTNSISPEFAAFLQESGITCVPRQKKSLARLCAEHNAQGVIVWEASGPVLNLADEKLYFHPSMAKVRLENLRNNNTADPFMQACAFTGRDHFLDCTLGLGADSIVAAYCCPEGKIIGLESSYIISHLIKWGMMMYKSKISWLNDAIRRINVINVDHKSYLKNQADNSFDIVYFDPMFRSPLYKSQAISTIRGLANPEPIHEETIKEAIRVARRRVVVKERQGSPEFFRLRIPRILGSPNNKIAYGIIDI
jgi:16S rRNA (guanine1516-N2)-methyltransferase